VARQVYNQKIDDRIRNMWRTHKNRVDQGLGGTYSSSGIHEGSRQDHNMINPVMSISGR